MGKLTNRLTGPVRQPGEDTAGIRECKREGSACCPDDSAGIRPSIFRVKLDNDDYASWRRSSELEEPNDRIEWAVIRVPLIFRCNSPETYNRDVSGLDKCKLLDLGPRTQWKVKWDNGHGDHQYGSIMSDRSAEELISPVRRIKQNRLTPWWRINATKAKAKGFRGIPVYFWLPGSPGLYSGGKEKFIHPAAMPTRSLSLVSL